MLICLFHFQFLWFVLSLLISILVSPLPFLDWFESRLYKFNEVNLAVDKEVVLGFLNLWSKFKFVFEAIIFICFFNKSSVLFVVKFVCLKRYKKWFISPLQKRCKKWELIFDTLHHLLKTETKLTLVHYKYQAKEISFGMHSMYGHPISNVLFMVLWKIKIKLMRNHELTWEIMESLWNTNYVGWRGRSKGL